MVIFVTNRNHDVVEVANELSVVNETKGKELFTPLIFEKELGLDTENTGLDPYTLQPLLVSIGNEQIQFVLDYTSVDIKWFLNQCNSYTTWVGHNLKYDYSVFKVQFGIELENIYDTMIAEQRLYANYFDIKHKPFNLVALVQRNVGLVPIQMNKDIRKEFVGVSASSFLFSNRHITYSAGDIGELFKIKKVQAINIEKYNMHFLLNSIEFPLIKIIADMELEGLDIDEKALLVLIDKNKTIQHQKAVELDEIFHKLRDEYAEAEENRFIRNGKYDTNRIKKQDVKVTTLFGEEVDAETINYSKKIRKTKVKKSPSYGINWSSAVEIIKIFGRLGFEVPTKKGNYVVPIIDNKNRIVNTYEEFTTNEKDFEQYLISNPETPTKKFIETLLEYRDVTTQLNKYGKDFLSKRNPVTKRIHTQFRQCDAVNGRLQSGGRKEQPDKINVQNVPAVKEYRELFYREGYDIITYDLSGAEVTVMADKARDRKLFDLAMRGDIHSHMATKGWRNIYNYRGRIKQQANRDSGALEFYKLSTEFVVSKKENADKRKTCKNLTFGTVYGCHAKKAGKTINVSPTEGQIYIDTIRKEIPLTFQMVDRNAAIALYQGYLVLNSRTNSRIWFPKVIQAIKNNEEIDFMDKHEVDGQARNVPISGTQADMVKEAMVEIAKYIKEHKLDAAILIQVHDELVLRCRPEYSQEFGLVVKKIMCETANRYLSFIQMEAEGHVGKTWTK